MKGREKGREREGSEGKRQGNEKGVNGKRRGGKEEPKGREGGGRERERGEKRREKMKGKNFVQL